MFRKHLLAPTILSLACVLLIADTAQAQRRIFGGRRGDGWYGNTWYGDGYYGNRNYGPGYGSTYSDSYYYTPSQQFSSQQQSPVDANTAQIRVIVPNPEAMVFFDDAPTRQTGPERIFYTPPLDTNAKNTYRIRVKWVKSGSEMTQERDVKVTPGRMAMVDFTQPQGEQIQPSKQPSKPLPEVTVLEGKIVRTGQDQFVIKTSDNREVTVFTNPETRYLRNNNAAVFTDLRAGTSVNVNVRMDGNRHIGNTITIRP